MGKKGIENLRARTILLCMRTGPFFGRGGRSVLLLIVFVLGGASFGWAGDFHAAPETKAMSCVACHESPHRIGWPEKCVNCHRVGGQPWTKAAEKFSPARHEKYTGFRLTPPHNSFECNSCHDSEKAFKKSHGEDILLSCGVCHESPHGNQFLGRHAHCRECHTRSFEKGVFRSQDHTVFPLTGGHKAVACNVCHLKEKESGVRRFAHTPTDCARCHREPHGGQFGREKNLCARCHSVSQAWKNVIFNHDSSPFPLGKAHEHLACNRCHPLVKQKQGSLIRQFKPIPHTCGDCHAS